jgi:hypothetical protein
MMGECLVFWPEEVEEATLITRKFKLEPDAPSSRSYAAYDNSDSNSDDQLGEYSEGMIQYFTNRHGLVLDLL